MNAEDGELVRFRSVVYNEWLYYGHAETADGAPHNVYTVARENLPAESGGDISTASWANAAFIMRKDDSTSTVTRLDTARYVDTYLSVELRNNENPQNKAIYCRGRDAMLLDQQWREADWVAEDISGDGRQIRLQSKTSPGTYLFVSEETKKKETWTTKYDRHKVYAAHRDTLTGTLWDATVFEVTNEGREAAELLQQEAEKDASLAKVYVEAFRQLINGSMGIGEIILVFNKKCPGVTNLRELMMISGATLVADPIVFFVLIMFNEKRIREAGQKPKWFGCIDVVFKLAELGFGIYIAMIAWPAGYYPGKNPKSYAEAVNKWREDTNAAGNATPPEDLNYCDRMIADAAFWLTISVIAFSCLNLVFLVLGMLGSAEEKKKPAKDTKDYDDGFATNP